jgi:hypothetical protein
MTVRCGRPMLISTAMPGLIRLTCAAAIAVTVSTAMSAQSRRELPLSWEATLGAARGRGGPTLAPYRDGVAVDAGVTWAFHDVRGGPLLLGLNVAKQAHIVDNLICPVSAGGCVPYYPQFLATSVLFGWQSSRPERGRIRLLGGPGVYSASDRDIGATPGWQGRVDLSTPPLWHTALVLSARTWVIPRAKGVRYRQHMFGGGIRIQ